MARRTWDTAAPVLAQLPAACLVVAVAAALYGWRARARPAAWLAVGYCVIVGLFGAMLRLPDWVRNLSPFSHAPRPPGEALLGAPFGVTAALAVALAGCAVALFRRRDIG